MAENDTFDHVTCWISTVFTSCCQKSHVFLVTWPCSLHVFRVSDVTCFFDHMHFCRFLDIFFHQVTWLVYRVDHTIFDITYHTSYSAPDSHTITWCVISILDIISKSPPPLSSIFVSAQISDSSTDFRSHIFHAKYSIHLPTTSPSFSTKKDTWRNLGIFQTLRF